ncbi:alkaline-phosphatase-like protein [Gorgonomyces haynaldii]|nr:alkaline-phosphatase-like protein [Gorgonomyces haynaldii]
MKLLILLFVGIGVYIFSQGYLLVRIVLRTQNNAQVFEKRVERVLLVMVDALRYDFIAEQEQQKHYTNKMSYVQELLKQNENTLLLKAMADPPTTTLQRLIAIMTGCLPTLVDAGSNFGSFEIQEDNLIGKLDRVLVMGDDTWTNLYPNLDKNWSYPSFDVWDLHTVDNQVNSHLFPLLEQKADWQLVVAHYLGVDHAGHRYGPDHPAMGDKLVQMNDIIKRIVEKIDNQTLLIVLGDHGMDKKGDHGGDSIQELSTGLLFYSKTPLFQQKCQIQDWMQESLKRDPELSAFVKLDQVEQIDIVSTISMVLGLGIPFGNLGTVIPHFFNHQQNCEEQLMTAYKANADQVYRYLLEYEQQRPDTAQAFKDLKLDYELANQLLQNGSKHDIFYHYYRFLRRTLLVCRKIWSRFDNTLIVMGLIVLGLSLVLSFQHFLVDQTAFGLFVVGGTIGYLRPIANVADPLTVRWIHESGFFASVLPLCYLNLKHFKLSITFKLDMAGYLAILMFAGCAASDSFTIFENFIVLYLIQTIHLLIAIICFYLTDLTKQKQLLATLFMLFVLTRVISLVNICRQDQGPYCVPTFNASSESSVASIGSSYLSVIGLLLVMIVQHGPNWFKFSLFLGLTQIFAYNHLVTLDANGFDVQKILLLWLPRLFWTYSLIVLYLIRQPDLYPPFVLMNLLIFQKPMGVFVLTLGYVYVVLLQSLNRTLTHLQKPLGTLYSCLLVLYGQHLFFSTGHHHVLPTVQYEMGFVGLDSVNWILSPFFVSLNTFGGPLLVGLFSDHTFLPMALACLFSATLFSGYFQRHSQSMRVWGPKFLFQTGIFVYQNLNPFNAGKRV